MHRAPYPPNKFLAVGKNARLAFNRISNSGPVPVSESYFMEWAKRMAFEKRIRDIGGFVREWHDSGAYKLMVAAK